VTPTRQLALALPSRPAQGRDDFLVAESNREAVEWIDRWPDWPGHALAIYGQAGCGKSHLAQVWRTRSGAGVVSTGELTEAVASGKLSGGVVVEHQDRRYDEEALLHVYNAVAQAGGTLLITSREPPARWPTTLPDLRSRLRATHAVGIAPPDDQLLAAVLTKLFGDRQLQVTPEVVTYVVARIERSFDAANRIVARLDQISLASKRAVTIPLASKMLGDDNGPIQS